MVTPRRDTHDGIICEMADHFTNDDCNLQERPCESTRRGRRAERQKRPLVLRMLLRSQIGKIHSQRVAESQEKQCL